MKKFRLLDLPPMTGAENMALDETLLELKGRGETPDTIRFMQFAPQTVLVGFHQAVAEEIRTEYCRANGIEINRRITGGGAIYFDESQLGWEVICDKRFFNITIPNNRLFKRLCDPVISGLDQLGVKSVFRPRNDIEVNGRKISGTGGTESGSAFLFQGTMLVDFDVDTMLKSLRIPVEKLKSKEIDSVKKRVTCLQWELGRTPPLEDIKIAIRSGFEEHLGIALEPGGLTEPEKRLFHKKITHFCSSGWIDCVNPQFQKREAVQAAYKSEAGLIRYTLVVNLPQKKIKDVYITGDFLSFPTRALYDLESMLRGAQLDLDHVRGIIHRFFHDGHIHIPDMAYDDFIKPLNLVFKKIAISEYGIPLEYCNLISVTNGTFDQVLQKRPSVLLLPYCSKNIQCELRYKKACKACGECSVGEAWRLGLTKKMKNICVVSFEDLMTELAGMKSAGVQAFIGCCCEPFFIKHADDFEKAGVPGILLDINNTTCYELDQAKAAYAGEFASQTDVNLDLLNRVLGLDIGI